MEEKQLSRKERRKLEDQGLIMNSAIRLFAEKGYHNVSMNEIASEAEFAVGTLYKFFKTKEDLYKSIFMELAHSIMSESLTYLSSDGDVLALLRGHLENAADFMHENHHLLRLYFMEIHGLAKNINFCLDETLLSLKHSVKAKLTELFKRGIKEGVFRKLDPYSMQVAFTGMFESFMLAWIDDPEKIPGGIEVDFIMDVTLNGMKTT